MLDPSAYRCLVILAASSVTSQRSTQLRALVPKGGDEGQYASTQPAFEVMMPAF